MIGSDVAGLGLERIGGEFNGAATLAFGRLADAPAAEAEELELGLLVQHFERWIGDEQLAGDVLDQEILGDENR